MFEKHKFEKHKMEKEMKFNLRQRLERKKCPINETFGGHFVFNVVYLL